MSRRVLEEYRLLIAEVYELAGASRRGSEQIAQAHGSTAARWHILSVVSDQSMSVASIARRLGLARQSVQRVVDDLASEGQVTLRPDPSDRRAPRVSVTPAGTDRLADLFAASDADREAILSQAPVSVRDLTAARSTIRDVLDALNNGDLHSTRPLPDRLRDSRQADRHRLTGHDTDVGHDDDRGAAPAVR